MSEIQTSKDIRHFISLGFPSSFDFRHCLKSEQKVWFTDACVVRMFLKTEVKVVFQNFGFQTFIVGETNIMELFVW